MTLWGMTSEFEEPDSHRVYALTAVTSSGETWSATFAKAEKKRTSMKSELASSA
jgi:hypothetical protein